jgi:phosphatidylinositol alpha-1,6-mannosyltransferase
VKRVLVVSTEFPPGPGGIGAHAHALVRGLAALGWEPVVITPQDYAAEEEISRFNSSLPFRIERLQTSAIAGVKRLVQAVRIRRVLSRMKPDVVVATGLRAVWLCGALVPAVRRPWLAVGHGKEFGVRGLERAITRRAYERSDAVVCVSRYTWEAMSRLGIVPRSGRVIPNGGDASTFTPLPESEIASFRRSLGLSDARILLTVGHVSERKGQDVVVRALARLRGMSDVHYLVAGLPTMEPEFGALAREVGVAERVHFLGRVDTARLVRLVNACDVFVMTSRHDAQGDFEGYGIAVVEAALCGRPAVVTGDSGLAEAILDGTTGTSVPENDVDATAAAIQDLLMDPVRCRTMGAAARARALSEQTWDRRVGEYDDVLCELVGAEGGRA